MEEYIFLGIQNLMNDAGINETFIYNEQDILSGKALPHKYPCVAVDFTVVDIESVVNFTQNHIYTITVKVLDTTFEENPLNIYKLKSYINSKLNYKSLTVVDYNSGNSFCTLSLTDEFGVVNFDQLYVYSLVYTTRIQIKNCPYTKYILKDVIDEIKIREVADGNGDSVFSLVLPRSGTTLDNWYTIQT